MRKISSATAAADDDDDDARTPRIVRPPRTRGACTPRPRAHDVSARIAVAAAVAAVVVVVVVVSRT
jgi:hypothetical protein